MNPPVAPILALSTAWNAQRHSSGETMLAEMTALGFHWIELHQELSASFFPEIAEWVSERKISVSHLRNFCFQSSLNGQVESPQFTAGDEKERMLAMRLTRQTIDAASRLGARAVVLRCGDVRGMNSHQHFVKLALRGQLYTKRFAREKIREILRREKVSPLLRKRVVASLHELGDYAAERGIRLGIENQAAYEAFPSEREFRPFLEELDHPSFGYWHNFGHAQMKQYLTLLDHRQWLESMGRRIIGCSVDDVRGLDRPHLPPFTGVIAYDKLMPLVSGCGIFVLDLRGFGDDSVITESVRRWKITFQK